MIEKSSMIEKNIMLTYFENLSPKSWPDGRKKTENGAFLTNGNYQF